VKVNGNDPLFTHSGDSFPPTSLMPIRLEIASRILAGYGPFEESANGGIPAYSPEDRAVEALRAADALIAAHNAIASGEGGDE
jgi:hypothetical protein